MASLQEELEDNRTLRGWKNQLFLNPTKAENKLLLRAFFKVLPLKDSQPKHGELDLATKIRSSTGSDGLKGVTF